MVTTPAERQTLTVEEAASLLGIGRTLAFQMARDGRLPVIRFGRRILVPRVALERMLTGDTQTTSPEPQRVA